MHEITTTVRRGIPTAISIDHYGYVVPDLDQAVAFFTDVLGFELLSLDDPIAFGDDSLARWYHVHPRASARFAFLGYGPAIIELTEWQTPDQNTIVPSNSDLGGRHFAIAVADVDAAIAYLKAQPDVRVFERSVWSFVYFTTPWGMTLQIVQPLGTANTIASDHSWADTSSAHHSDPARCLAGRDPADPGDLSSASVRHDDLSDKHE